MNENLHVSIENPVEQRKKLLRLNMDMISVMQRLEKIKRIKAKKAVQLNRLKMLTKRISRDVAEFRNELPSGEEPKFLKTGAKMQKLLKKSAREIKAVEKPEKKEIDTDRLSIELRKLKEKIEAL